MTSTMVFEHFVFGVVPLTCTKKIIITKLMQRGMGGGGGGGGRGKDRFHGRSNPNYDSARFTIVTLMKFKGLLEDYKLHVADYTHLVMCMVLCAILLRIFTLNSIQYCITHIFCIVCTMGIHDVIKSSKKS